MVLEFPHSLMPKQADFVDSKHRFTLYSGGVGSGKTLAGCERAIEFNLLNPKAKGLIGTQTYNQLKDTTYATFMEIIESLQMPVIKGIKEIQERVELTKENKSRLIVTFMNGSKILFRTLDDESKLRSLTLDWFYIDEATTVKEAIWKQLVSRLRGKNMKDGKQYGFITTNPDVIGHWVYKTFIRSDDEKRPIDRNRFKVIFASSNENYNLPYSYLEDLNNFDEDYRLRFVEGQWGIIEGVIYKMFKHDVHVQELNINHERWRDFYRGVDFGYENPFACVFMAVDGDGNCFVFDEYYTKHKTIQENVEEINNMYSHIYFDETYIDPSSPATVDEFRANSTWKDEKGKAYNQLIYKAKNKVEEGIQSVIKKLQIKKNGEPSLYIHPRCKNLIQEIYGYKRKKDNSTDNYMEKPDKCNDHLCDALRYAIYSVFDGNKKMDLG